MTHHEIRKEPLEQPVPHLPAPYGAVSGTAGTGRLHLAASPSRAQFSTLSASYPLKLLSPTPLTSQPVNVGAVYTLAYGGGLVAGDLISLRVEVDEGCGLVMLTQGSTKVFKHRPGLRPLSHRLVRSRIANGPGEDGLETTKQRLHVTLKPGSWTMILPDSISPFRGSKFSQAQRFVLPDCGTASVLILDWLNSGRGSPSNATDGAQDEIWAMDRYSSTNEIMISSKLLMRERLLLDQSPSSSADLRKRMEPYHVYATMLICGPHFLTLLRSLENLAEKTSQFQLSTAPSLTWTFSRTDSQSGVLRVAATEVEDARVWLRVAMDNGGVYGLVGDGLWSRILR